MPEEGGRGGRENASLLARLPLTTGFASSEGLDEN